MTTPALSLSLDLRPDEPTCPETGELVSECRHCDDIAPDAAPLIDLGIAVYRHLECKGGVMRFDCGCNGRFYIEPPYWPESPFRITVTAPCGEHFETCMALVRARFGFGGKA